MTEGSGFAGAGSGDWRRRLPALGRLLDTPELVGITELYGREQVRVQAQIELDALRELKEPPASGLDVAVAALPGQIGRGLAARVGAPLRRVLNASGVFLHTNLGRAPLPRPALGRLDALLDAACDLELDLETGRRAQRQARVAGLLQSLTGAGAALVVNNNAAALVLALHTLARGQRVVVSRGELVEIGGSFRIPDILAAAGAELVEVGTTNRTRIGDYAAAVAKAAGLLLKVLPSNYQIRGFVEEATVAELAALAQQQRVPLLVDEGSGLLRTARPAELRGHPSHAELLAAGVDLVCGSGDKLLGGPQAGLLLGRAELIDRCHHNPLYRALRPGRTTLVLLEAVLRLHLVELPLPLHGLWPAAGPHHDRLTRIAAALGGELVPAEAFVGGGAAPERPIAGWAIGLPGAGALLQSLRTGEPAVVGYLRDGRLLLDLRTVAIADDDALVRTVHSAQAKVAQAS